MMTTFTIPTVTKTTTEQAPLLAGANPTTFAAGGGRRMPLFVPRGQAYYWTLAWRVGEAEALREIKDGDVRSFKSGASAAEWLLADDDA